MFVDFYFSKSLQEFLLIKMFSVILPTFYTYKLMRKSDVISEISSREREFDDRLVH